MAHVLSADTGSVPVHMVQPLRRFADLGDFVRRHEQGTLIEMENEMSLLKQMNDRRHLYQCWPIAPIPGLKTSFAKSWLFLVKIPKLGEDVAFPTQTDRFTIDMEVTVKRADGTYSLVHLPTTRIPNPYEDVPNLSGNADVCKCAAFKVDVPRSWKTEDGQHVELDLMAKFQIARAIDDFDNVALDKGRQFITIRWDTFSLTFEAELAALRSFTEHHRKELGPSHKAQLAFKMIQSFGDCGVWKNYYNLHDEFPHLKNPTHPFHHIPSVLLEKFKAFNADHRAAYDGLTRIPNGLYFVNGCPGAGKTEWNMILAGLIHSKRRPRSKKRHSPILFLVDLNSTADDAANRYYKLCKEAGLKARVVRMHGWPYEMRNSGKLNKSGPADKSTSESTVDFTKSFLTAAGLARHTKISRNLNKAPTLDEEAWDYFERHKDDGFPALNKLLLRMESGEAFSTEDWRCLRSLVCMLYRAVLAQTDFVATTPVAAYGSFSKLFRPDVVFVDEAPHARELTTLIPLAYFDPIAWIFTGDVNQTRPFVKSEGKARAKRDGLRFNPFAEQLRWSTMARAAAVNALNSKLLVNNRAHGNLHRLPSKMFYQGEMASGHDDVAMYPPSTLHLKSYLEKLGTGTEISENRVVVRLKDSREETRRNSFWNPTHHNWVIQQAEVLLKDTKFRGIGGGGGDKLGTIMIQTPYSTAFRQYQTEVKRWPKDWQERVQVLTVDKAQGNQADMVFLDLVRTTGAGFMDDPQRLNVAITRARQAEVIVMHAGMKERAAGKRQAVYTSQVWDDAIAERRVVTVV